jgi:hypothetical protein
MNIFRKYKLIYLSLAVTLLLAACVPGDTLPTPTGSPTNTRSDPAASGEAPASTPTTEAEITTIPTAATKQLQPDSISDSEATELMYQLSEPGTQEFQAAIDRILETEDSRFIPVFIELLRANQIGLMGSVLYMAPIEALETLSGQDFRTDWAAWIEWYGDTDYTPPPGFTGWKGRLLSRIDPAFGEFLQDKHPSTIRVEEIQWGGVVVDGIPALDNATMIPAGKAEYLDPEEPVFGISINGDSRAYPLRILDWHEMANDVVGGVPVSLAYCTLCGAGVAYDGRASDGETYTFGSSGFLFRSNKLMYDRQTRTLWNQLTGQPVLGELADTDVKLDLLPVVVTSWQDWQDQHPDTLVLDLETGFQRPYVPGAAYGDYFSVEDTMFPVWQRSELLQTKDRIYALQIDGIPKAYPVDLLVEEQVVNDTIAETDLVLIASRGDITVQGDNQRVGKVSYNAGGEVRAYQRDKYMFSPGPDPDNLLDASGNAWQMTEEALIGPDGEELARINGHLAYWFGWFSFFPKTQLYGQP